MGAYECLSAAKFSRSLNISSIDMIERVCLTSLAPFFRRFKTTWPEPSICLSMKSGLQIQTSVRKARLAILSSSVISPFVSAIFND